MEDDFVPCREHLAISGELFGCQVCGWKPGTLLVSASAQDSTSRVTWPHISSSHVKNSVSELGYYINLLKMCIDDLYDP